MSPPPTENLPKRKVLSPQTREVIANVYKFMKKEASLDSPIRLQQVQQRVSMATGVSHSTVKRIVRQLKALEAAGETASFVASVKNIQTRSVQKTQSNKLKKQKEEKNIQTRSLQKTQNNKIKKQKEEEVLEPTVEVFVTENCLSNFASEGYQSEDNPLDQSTSGDEDVTLEHMLIDEKYNEISSLPVQVFIKEESCDGDDDNEMLTDKKHVQTGQYLRSILLNGSRKK